MTPDLSMLTWPWTLAIAAFAVVQAALLLYSAHRVLTLRRWARARCRPTKPVATLTDWPSVTVQLPVFNERTVVVRLIDAAAALEYPAGRLEIQVLDDSTDETTAWADERAAHWRTRGVDLRVLHRVARVGFKAGALAAGLARARGELVAVFDADFVPAPDFLRRIVPRFDSAEIGMVQARWGHLNRECSLLTAAQAVMLDAHFLIEHEARRAAGLFFNFNGTAGVWRRACIEDAGGWACDTLTEDLDLSYRAQLRGWRFETAPDLVVPAELPADARALKSQQQRWAKGSMQTARKLLPALLRSSLPWRVKSEAVVHLTGNVAYPLLLLSGVLLVAVVAVPGPVPAPLVVAADMTAVTCGVLPMLAFLWAGQRATGRARIAAVGGVPWAVLVAAGLTLNNTLAVLAGLRRHVGDWERTPKTGETDAIEDGCGARAYLARRDPAGRIELLLAAGFFALAGYAWHASRPRAIPFLLVLAAGLAQVGARSWWEALRHRIATDLRATCAPQ